MSPDTDQLFPLCNPLTTVEQLSTSSSQFDGVSADLETSLRFAGAQLTQAAGILLRLPQEIIARAIVTFYRFYVGSEGGSFRINALKDVSAACIYLTAEPSFYPLSPRSILNVYAYLLSPSSPLRQPTSFTTADPDPVVDPESSYLSEGTYQTQKATLLQTESIILRAIAFNTQVITPHHLALTYLQALGVLPQPPTPVSTALAKRTLAYLNTALLSPQLLYLTHQPNALAVSAGYLAAREVGVRLSTEAWWEVFDVDREALGFLSVALLSCEEWVRVERTRWGDESCPLTLGELNDEIAKREAAEGE